MAFSIKKQIDNITWNGRRKSHMMQVGGVTRTDNMPPGYISGNIKMDSASRSIKKQIENAQKQLQELSANEDMPLEEKMKKRQEIQQEITSLNQQIIQHQIEQRKQQQEKGFSVDNMDSGRKKAVKTRTGGKGNVLSQAGMQSIISADSSIKQSKVQGSVATKMKGMANVLESEIKQDAAMGGNTEAKQAALAEIEKKAMEATSSQTSTLAKANQELKEAAGTEQDNSTDKVHKNEEETGKIQKNNKNNEEEKGNTENENGIETQAADTSSPARITPPPVSYKTVDISI